MKILNTFIATNAAIVSKYCTTPKPLTFRPAKDTELKTIEEKTTRTVIEMLKLDDPFCGMSESDRLQYDPNYKPSPHNSPSNRLLSHFFGESSDRPPSYEESHKDPTISPLPSAPPIDL